MAKYGPRGDRSATISRSGRSATILRIDPIPMISRADPIATIPRVDPIATIPRADPIATIPLADQIATIPRVDHGTTIPRTDPISRTSGYGAVERAGKVHPPGARRSRMGFREDAVNAVRRTIVPQLHYLIYGSFGGYAVSHTTAEEYVCTAHCSEEALEAALSALGFSRNPIASLKVRMDGNTSEGSWVWRSSPLADHQLHVVLHAIEDREERIDVYAHWECSWIRHPYKHYVARGYDAEKGVDLTRRLLEQLEGETIADGEVFEREIDSGLVRQLSDWLHLSYYQGVEASISLRDRLPLAGADDEHREDREGSRDDVSPRITDTF